MKTVNTNYGIDTNTDKKPPKWYHWHRFPLLPIFSYKPADDYNESGFDFSWLNVRIWSIMSPDISVGATIEDIGAYIKIRIPYIIIVVWIMWFPEKWHQKLWRKGNLR